MRVTLFILYELNLHLSPVHPDLPITSNEWSVKLIDINNK